MSTVPHSDSDFSIEFADARRLLIEARRKELIGALHEARNRIENLEPIESQIARIEVAIARYRKAMRIELGKLEEN